VRAAALGLAAAVACGEDTGPVPPGEAPMVAIPATPGGPGAYWVDAYEHPGIPGEKPTTYKNLPEAAALCETQGKRLCTAAEWRRACQGPRGLRYGYGDRFEKGRCHSEALLPSGHTSMMDPDELVVPAGTFAACVTEEGVHDMPGSVEEWVLDDWKGMPGMLEGGAWYTLAEYADCSGTYSRHPDYRLSTDKRVFSAGFRCCWTPEPPSSAAIQADAARRIAAAQLGSSTASYEPDNEVEVAPGLFMDTFEHPNRAGEVPTVGLPWTAARDACAGAGKRLCSAKEWEDACAGPDRNRWPYGDRPIDGACATMQPTVKASGVHLACSSPAGVHDLVGNVWEWTATPLDAPVLAPPDGGDLYELRGGSFSSDDLKATCLPGEGYPVAPAAAVFPDVGFRCCRGEATAPVPRSVDDDVRCPADMIAMDGYCIDQHEHPNRFFHPVKGELDFAAAQAACDGVGKHVCTEAEWTAACEGPQHRRWPYGDTYVRGACQDSSDSKLDQGGGATKAGTRTGCHTPEGVRDQSGNLWEWVARDVGGGRVRGVIRGGGWNISAGLGQCRAVFEPEASYRSAEVGTRCCASPAEARALLAEAR